MTALIRISIVTYNSKHIFDVLDQLKTEFKDDSRIALSIFDNCSSSDYQERLSTYSDFIDITFDKENRGFGYGHNHNLLTANEPYFLIFNPDIILKKADLNQMLDYMEAHPEAAMTSPRVLNYDGTTQYLVRERVTVFDYMIRYIPFGFVKRMFAKRLAKYECRDLSETEIVPVRMSSGCFMFIRGEVFKQIDGFDPRYFMYFEDNDLCLKLEKADMKIMYIPTATVVHYYEKGAHKSGHLFRIFLNSMIKFFNKWGWSLF